jgi:sugar phosphate isomerase/epimerase
MIKGQWRKLKLSLSNWMFCKKPLDESISFVRKLGFENLEFSMKCVENEYEKSMHIAKRLVDFYGLNCLSVHSASLYVKNANEITKAIFYGKVSIDFAFKLSSPILVVHSFVSRELPENLRKKFLTRIFEEFNHYARSLNVKLALENLSWKSHGFGKSVSEVEEILRIVDDGSMGVTLDFCHAEAIGQTLGFLEKFKNRIFNVHLSNLNHGVFDEETPSLEAFLAKLREYGYSGPLTIELNSKCSMEEILKTKIILQRII